MQAQNPVSKGVSSYETNLLVASKTAGKNAKQVGDLLNVNETSNNASSVHDMPHIFNICNYLHSILTWNCCVMSIIIVREN